MNTTFTPQASQKLLTYIASKPQILADIYDDICVGIAVDQSAKSDDNRVVHTLSTPQDVGDYFHTFA